MKGNGDRGEEEGIIGCIEPDVFEMVSKAGKELIKCKSEEIC